MNVEQKRQNFIWALLNSFYKYALSFKALVHNFGNTYTSPKPLPNPQGVSPSFGGGRGEVTMHIYF